MSSRRTNVIHQDQCHPAGPMSSTRTNVIQQDHVFYQDQYHPAGLMSSTSTNVIQQDHVIYQDTNVIQQGPMPCGCQEAPMSYGSCGAGPRPAAASQAAHLRASGSARALESPLRVGMTAQRRPARPPQAEGPPHKASCSGAKPAGIRGFHIFQHAGAALAEHRNPC